MKSLNKARFHSKKEAEYWHAKAYRVVQSPFWPTSRKVLKELRRSWVTLTASSQALPLRQVVASAANEQAQPSSRVLHRYSAANVASQTCAAVLANA